MSFGYDPELPAGFQDADIEQAEFEAESNRFWHDRKLSDRLYNDGELDRAASICPHGGGYPLDSLAAQYANDPGVNGEGWRCNDCGSRMSGETLARDARVIIPCEYRPS